ncbi:hypothetical protein [Pseudomonas aeruginosa]|uniref:hypothetical protein n=1 Tax=Pseudomonas aeruginosa TaxID=287 RepID=UPI00071BE3E4|nr:hypothetical protein [Pseudomonas aeruginosa]KSG80638.1 hypothetical protein AO954_32750 [Pseudomonas aeruginosa]MBA5114432.1 hypothetical protein [Pseudomonas aeruginosa]
MSYGQALEYVCQQYGVPAHIGRMAIACGQPGIIVEDRGNYIGVTLDSDPTKAVNSYHPTHDVEYLGMARQMPLKEWEVLTGDFDWFQVDYLIGDARHYVHRVYAETRSKAKYKVFKDLEEVFDSAEAMLCFKVRRAR